MTSFRETLPTTGLSTDDVLLRFLPLVQQTIDLHDAGFVAPFDGLDALRVIDAKIEFTDTAKLKPTTVPEKVAEIQDADVSGDSSQIGKPDAVINRPVYLAGYVSWEQKIGNHDPLTDVFSLGMILASLAVGLDFTKQADLERFVGSRKNLFALRGDLHPVLAQAIVRMTELDRRHRAQDLAPLLKNLKDYRNQSVDFDFELSKIKDFKNQTSQNQRKTILTKLQQRLFDISRRNKLLHHRPSMQSVNLTVGSCPIESGKKGIAGEDIFVWNSDFQQVVVAAEQANRLLSLNDYLNFTESVYLPKALDRLITDSRRDEAEYGFAQLRIIACFLHWTDLKAQPIQQYDSPLVLIPVGLRKKKGVRDSYQLEIKSSDAQVNPVVRYLFKQHYGIELPESLDLTKTSLEDFFTFLQQKVSANEAKVSLAKIDEPNVTEIHAKAKSRLEQHLKRSRKLPKVSLTDTAEDPEQSPDPKRKSAESVETRESLDAESLSDVNNTETVPQDPKPTGPKSHCWTFDLCNVVLGNFRYQTMSLVRDYESLLDGKLENPAFEAIFSLSPKELVVHREILPLQERFDVVACDPTQAESIAQSRTGKSYIIQGPPGTGKSQTITNLIADYAAQGKRVLFVCEKRAAIDVVYVRLQQVGLDGLCSLIHDSQTDKKGFVMDLKQVYENVLAEAENPAKTSAERDALLKDIDKELAPFDSFDALMQKPLFTPKNAEPLTTRNLLRRSMELEGPSPQLSPLDKERLPDYGEWIANAEHLERFSERVDDIEATTKDVFATHPLRRLSTELVGVSRPLETVTQSLEPARKSLVDATNSFLRCGVPKNSWNTISCATNLIEYAGLVSEWVSSDHLSLLSENSDRSKALDEKTKVLADLDDKLKEAQKENGGWFEGKKLSPQETTTALEQAKGFENNFFSWLSPARWRLRRVLSNSYNFAAHRIPPSWTTVLTSLDQENKAAAKLESATKDFAREWNVSGNVQQWATRLSDTRKRLAELPPAITSVHASLLAGKTDQSQHTVSNILAAKPVFEAFENNCRKILEVPDSITLEQIDSELTGVVKLLEENPTDLNDVLDCIAELKELPEDLRSAIREIPLTLPELETASAGKTSESILRHDKTVQKFNGDERDKRAARLEKIYDDWQNANAAEIRRRFHARFCENIRFANGTNTDPTDQRSGRGWKSRYNAGRRELEHEFGKTMRYKSIRDLVAGESGDVVRDLKPIWLMSPTSVSDTMPLDVNCFDVVIFDEASQITLEEAVPPVCRATQTIVVGDEMQLPPTNFFARNRDDDAAVDDEEDDDGNGAQVQYDLDSSSFLNHAAKNLASTMLGWHYRSRSESLISFSNAAFYHGRLLTVPDVRVVEPQTADHNSEKPDEKNDNPFQFIYLHKGLYEDRRNRDEAEKIAQITKQLLESPEHPTIGIIAFSEAQQGEIDDALERLADADPKFAEFLEAERQREKEGQFVGLLVKNLENIQGDERDVIIISICYGYGPNGKMLMNFGPINKSGGERRLNVAFSRAKMRMIVVSSIKGDAITNDYNAGAACLKNYLKYAEAVSTGQTDAARAILRTVSGRSGGGRNETVAIKDPMPVRLAKKLEANGYLVDFGIGSSDFRCDLAVRKKGDRKYRLGILIDNAEYYRQTATDGSADGAAARTAALLGREMMRPKLLRAFQWDVAVVFAKDWFESPETVVDGLLRRLEEKPG